MKKLFVILGVLGSSLVYGQQDKGLYFGIKAGLNYGDNGIIEISDLADAGSNIFRENAKDRMGYHVGGYFKAQFTDNFYLKPELLYTQNRSAFEVSNRSLDYDIKKIDLPILIGTRIVGPLHVFGGPALQFIVENELENVTLGQVRDEFTVGLQFGIGLQLNQFNVDLRYERGLNTNESQAIDDVAEIATRVDSRPNQFILSVSLDLNKQKQKKE